MPRVEFQVFFNVMLSNREWEKYLMREHPDFYRALMRQLIACRQQRIFVSETGRYETPKEKFVVSVNDGSWLIFHPRRKNGERVHIKNMKNNYRKCIRSYASFLRADGIDNADEMLYYILHYTFWHISFNRMLKKITYDETRPMINSVIDWIMKKNIKDVDHSKFIDPRKTAAPDEIYTANGGIRKAKKRDKIILTKQAHRKITDKEIEEKYNPDLTNKENAANIGIGLTRLKEWKKEYFNNIEDKENKVKRLYNPALSWKKNKEIIGLSVNTIKKYLKMEKPSVVDLGKEDLERTDSENQFTECLNIDDELMSRNADIDTIKTNMTQDCVAAELETAVSENQFTDCHNLDDDEFCRWMFGDEFMENIAREKERNALVYGTEEVIKMVV